MRCRQASTPAANAASFTRCVLAGPMFANRIDVDVGEIVERGGFVFADFRPAEAGLYPATV